MALEVGELYAEIKVDQKAFDTGLKSAETKFKQLGSRLDVIGGKMSSIGGTMTMGVTMPIIGAGVAAFKLASDMEESINKVNVAFGDNSGEIKAWAENTLNQFGIAKGTALDMAAGFGDMATSMGLSTGQASDMATSMVGLAGDLASFKNIGIDQAMTALNGVFTGETESLKMLGVVMTQANLDEYALSRGIKTKVKDMTQAEQVQLRYNYVMDKTNNAQGDFSRTSEGAANQMRIFKESLKELGASFGEDLLPAITPIIKGINEMIQRFGDLSPEAKKTITNIALGLAVGGPLMVGLGSVAGAISNIIRLFKGPAGVGAAAKVAGGQVAAAGAVAKAGWVPLLTTLGQVALALGGTYAVWELATGYNERKAERLLKEYAEPPQGTGDFRQQDEKALQQRDAGWGNFKKFADGGIATHKQLAWVAEKEPELITPLSKLSSAMGGVQRVIHSGVVTHRGINSRDELVAIVEQQMGDRMSLDQRRMPNRPGLLFG